MESKTSGSGTRSTKTPEQWAKEIEEFKKHPPKIPWTVNDRDPIIRMLARYGSTTEPPTTKQQD